MASIPIYLTRADVALEIGCDISNVTRMCQQGRIKGAHKRGGRWYIPAPLELVSKVPSGYVDTKEAAIQMGIRWLSGGRDRVNFLCRLGRIEGAKRNGRAWIVPTPIVCLPPSGRKSKDQ